MEYFMTASKIFRSDKLSGIQASASSKSRHLKGLRNQMPKKESGADYFHKIEEVREEVYDDTLKDATRFCFLLQAHHYLAALNSSSESPSKLAENRTVLDLFFSKLGLKFEERASRRKNGAALDALRGEGEDRIRNHSRLTRRIKAGENSLVQKWGLDLKKEYSLGELTLLFNKVVLSLFSSTATPTLGCSRSARPLRPSLNSGRWPSSGCWATWSTWRTGQNLASSRAPLILSTWRTSSGRICRPWCP
jgi:hypothetical protein